MILNILRFFGTNPYALGVASLCGIGGLLLTVHVAIKTNKISSILRYNEISSQYNKERKAFQNTFEGHRRSILEDNIKTDKLMKDILKNVEEYNVKYHALFSFNDRFVIWRLKRILRKEVNNVDFNSVCNDLSVLSGRLAKREEMKNG